MFSVTFEELIDYFNAKKEKKQIKFYFKEIWITSHNKILINTSLDILTRFDRKFWYELKMRIV